ncbi:hypothetical protein FB451DRAFT_1189978 [Mycena latifolia]|nr:hypothetical protein FB451DRAFT_1189978 [Mycena latifolia]
MAGGRNWKVPCLGSCRMVPMSIEGFKCACISDPSCSDLNSTNSSVRSLNSVAELSINTRSTGDGITECFVTGKMIERPREICCVLGGAQSRNAWKYNTGRALAFDEKGVDYAHAIEASVAVGTGFGRGRGAAQQPENKPRTLRYICDTRPTEKRHSRRIPLGGKPDSVSQRGKERSSESNCTGKGKPIWCRREEKSVHRSSAPIQRIGRAVLDGSYTRLTIDNSHVNPRPLETA